MNYLAHAYLSFRDPDLLVGNMISDFVKGKKQYDYPPGIQQGIRLHREIDQFTDDHPATRTAKALLKPAVGLYAGAFVDVVYDHFLALDGQHFSERSLQQFSREVYARLAEHESVLPPRFAAMLPYMTAHDWLYNYRHTSGIGKSFGGVAHRAQYLDSSDAVFALFLEHYETLRTQYHLFFPELFAYASAAFATLRPA